ncbi:unnamed protein product, partial [Didymodactylos carnosus]
AQNFDIIRFSTYRTACKLRFIQKKLNLHLLDLPNVIEALRECSTWVATTTPTSNRSLTSSPYNSNLFKSDSLSSPPTITTTAILDRSTFSSMRQPQKYMISSSRLITFLTSIYTNLNKRLPSSQQLNIEQCVKCSTAWFLFVYDSQYLQSIRLSSFKVASILLCAGKLADKMKYLFTTNSQSSTSSSSQTMNSQQIDELLHEILAIPQALQETPSFPYRANLAQSFFPNSSMSVTLPEFLETLILSDSVPTCLHLCQDCFWRGRISDDHQLDHEIKEYTYFQSPVKEFRQSLRRSFQCVPKNDENKKRQATGSPSPSHSFFSWKSRKSHHHSTLSSPSSTQPSSPLTVGKDDNHIKEPIVRLITPVIQSKFNHQNDLTELSGVNDDEYQQNEYQTQRVSTIKSSPKLPNQRLRAPMTGISNMSTTGISNNKQQYLDTDEHVEIACYAQQLASLMKKNTTQRFSSSPMNFQINNHYHHHHDLLSSGHSNTIMIDQPLEKRLMIAKLEAKNRRILREINKLRDQLKRRGSLDFADIHAHSDTDASSYPYCLSSSLATIPMSIVERNVHTLPHQHSSPLHYFSPYSQQQHYHFTTNNNRFSNDQQRSRSQQTCLIKRGGSDYIGHELNTLIKHKQELETRIDHLQQSKEELTSQLDTLSKLRKYTPYQQQQRTTPKGRLSISPERMISSSNNRMDRNMPSFRSYSTPATPTIEPLYSSSQDDFDTNDCYPAPSTAQLPATDHAKSLRTDLLIAADSLTSAMSSLVKQLNTESDESLVEIFSNHNNNKNNHHHEHDDDDKDDENKKIIYFSSRENDQSKTATIGQAQWIDENDKNSKNNSQQTFNHNSNKNNNNNYSISQEILQSEYPNNIWKTEMNGENTNHKDNNNSVDETNEKDNDSGSRTDEESLLTTDDDSFQQERTTDDDLLRTTDDEDASARNRKNIVVPAVVESSALLTRHIEQ